MNFAQQLGVKLDAMTQTATGLYYQDVVAGKGDASAVGRDVTVHYTGWSLTAPSSTAARTVTSRSSSGSGRAR